jgi:Carboxypeptidase regulatory-like domain
MRRISIGTALIAFLIISPIFAQTTTGRISGTVMDSSGGVIMNVKVTITDETTLLSRTASTDENGLYVVTNLPAGVYSVKVEAAGFKSSLKTGYQLVNDGRLTLDFKLEAGDISAMVEVTSAAGESVNSTSGEVARVVDGEQVRNMALNTRNYVELFSLIPGAVLTTDDTLQMAVGSSSGQTSINGNRTNTFNLTVDGGYNLGPTNNSILINNIGIDYIQEVKIQTSNFSAEYGRHSGAAVNVVTRGGTNQFHGSVFEFLRNEVTDARAALSPEKPALRYNNFGYSFGGPLIKQKLFFFGGQEWKYIRRSTNAARQTLPTTAEMNGDFSYRLRGRDGIVGTADDGVLRNPSNPTNTCRAPTITNGVVTRQAVRTGCFPNNTIPASMITADGRAIANVYRTAAELAVVFTDEPVANNATYQRPNPFDFRQDMIRLDYRHSDNHQIYGRYIRDINDYATPYGPAGESPLPVTPVTRLRPTNSTLVQHTWLVSSRMTNEARAMVAVADQRSFPVGETWMRDTHGFVYPQAFLGEVYDNGIPDVSVNGFASFRGPTFSLVQPTTEIAFNDNFTMVAGNHTAKFGAAYMRSRLDQNGRPRYTGNINFNPTMNANSTGNAFADALLGYYRTYDEAADDPAGYFRSTQYDFYVSDTWKVSRRLNLEFGVRFQNSIPYYARANNFTNFDPSLYDPAQAVTVTRMGLIDLSRGGNRYNGLIRAGSGVPQSEWGRVPSANSPEVLSIPTGGPRSLYETSHLAAPRFSFAYSPFADNKTAIRGGFGIFYDTNPGDIPASMLNNPPFNNSVNLESGNLADPLGGTTAAPAPFSQITAVDPNMRLPYTMNFSLGVQRELPLGLFAEATYVGNLGRRLLRNPNINQVSLDLLYNNSLLPDNQQATQNALRPYQGYSNIRMYMSDSNSNYNALQLYVTKRKGSLRLTGSFTWSKALTDASSHTEDPENPYNRGFNYGPATFDRRRVFVSTYTYSLPSFRGKNGLAKALLGGYEVSGITRLQSGPYVTIRGNALGGVRRADYIGGDVLVPESERTADNWINRDAFAVAPRNRRGTSGVGIVEAPGMMVWNFSLRKRTPIKERVVLRFQADLFNAFNRANFTGLTTTLTDIDFGRLESTGQPRQIQFGLKVEF